MPMHRRFALRHVRTSALGLIASASLFASSRAAAQTAEAPATSTTPPSVAPTTDKPPLIPASVDPSKDKSALEHQGDSGLHAGDVSRTPGEDNVFSEDWWRHTRPIVELHGFFRTRSELFHNFSLGRLDAPGTGLFPRPIDDAYTPVGANGTQLSAYSLAYCGTNSTAQTVASSQCTSKTIASANMRFRIDPEIHISDNLRIVMEVDALDNLVMGSTPEGSTATASTTTPGVSVSGSRSGYTPFGFASQTQVPPTAGVNGYQNSIEVKRVWAEYLTPIGQIRFGRMPSHWGLGILENSGDTIDSDYQTTVDRFMFVTGLKQYDIYLAAAWDFPDSGRTSATVQTQQGQPYNVSQLENVNQWVLALFRRVRPDKQAQLLARGETVINGGLYNVYRQQILANNTSSGNYASDLYGTGTNDYEGGLGRIGARAYVGDGWLQILTKRFRWETEAAYIYGTIENAEGSIAGNTYNPDNYKLRQFGAATQLEYKTLGDDLRLHFDSGIATGDQGVTSLSPGESGLQARSQYDHTVSTFQFNPDYRVDLILFRQILSRVEGAYYFKPGVEYDFSHALDGERFGGRADAIWSRASKFVQDPGHKPDLGVELDVSLYYQSRDGSLNDDPTKIGGFFAMLQYGVLFPLGGLGYMNKQIDPTTQAPYTTSTAQTVRLFLGVVY